ncbi:hypothetical protein DFH07DRAFT_89365 [Mycena maculata]|uniref:Uncharacterized protein n=1 Tax=Mycena maculata TaxID=230809 RepID=A0AAD7K0H9_9AGAR|nr:hypothetical protein DFH07DRAFT_89365 [Mycena maculata]
MLPVFQLVAGFFFGFSLLAATYVHPLVPSSSLVVWRGEIPTPPPSSSPAVPSTPSKPRPNLVADRTVPNLATPVESKEAGSTDLPLWFVVAVVILLFVSLAGCLLRPSTVDLPRPVSVELPLRQLYVEVEVEPRLVHTIDLGVVADRNWIPAASHNEAPVAGPSSATNTLVAPHNPPMSSTQAVPAPPPPAAASASPPAPLVGPPVAPTVPATSYVGVPRLDPPSAASSLSTPLHIYVPSASPLASTLPPPTAPPPTPAASPLPAPGNVPSSPPANEMETTTLPGVGPSGAASPPSFPELPFPSSSSYTITFDDLLDYSTWERGIEEEEEEEVRRELEAEIEERIEEVEEQAEEEPQQQVAGVEPTTSPVFPPIPRASPPSPTDDRTVDFSFDMSSRVHDTFAGLRHGRASSSSSSLETVQSSGERDEEWEEDEVKDEAQLEHNPLPMTPHRSTAGQLFETPFVPSLADLRRRLAELGHVSPERPARSPDAELADLSVSELLPLAKGLSSTQQADSEADVGVRNASTTEILDADQQRQLEERLQTQFVLNRVHVARSTAQHAPPLVADAAGPGSQGGLGAGKASAAREHGGQTVAPSGAVRSAAASANALAVAVGRTRRAIADAETAKRSRRAADAEERERQHRVAQREVRMYGCPERPLEAEKSIAGHFARRQILVDRTPQGSRTRKEGARQRRVESSLREEGQRVDENTPVGVSAKTAGKRKSGAAEILAPVLELDADF